MGSDPAKISKDILPANFFMQLCVRPAWANYKLLAAYIIQAELGLYTNMCKGEVAGRSWTATNELEALNGTLTLKVLRNEGFFGPLLRSNPNIKDYTKHKTVLGQCYELFRNSRYFNRCWHFDDFDFESSFSVKTFRGLSVAPLHLRELARIRANILKTLTCFDSEVTDFEIDIITLFIYCKYLPTATRLKQLKRYSNYLDMADRHGWEPFATSVWHIRQAKDPFITLARFLNKKIPVLPEFLVPFVPHFKEPCVKNVF